MPLFRNRFAALLAMLAVALQGFWPALVQAQAGASDSLFFGSICSVDSGENAGLAGGSLPSQGGIGKHAKHCALCFAGGDRVQAIAVFPVQAFLVPANAVEPPAALPAAQFRSLSASPAHPRAPPVQI